MQQLALLRSRWTDVEGRRVHARVPRGWQPSAWPPVVLVHGIGVSSRYMAPLAVRLARGFRVLAIDLPGFGLSEKPARPLDLDGLADALSGFLRAEGLDRAALVANSFGCQVLVRFALRHPDLVTRLVLQGPTGDPQLSVPRLVARWLYEGTREPFSLNAVIARDYFDCGLRRVLSAFHASVTDSMLAELPRVAVPTLVVRGERDAIATQRWCEEIVSRLPRGRLALVSGAAHAMNYGSPDAFAGAVAGFLRGDDANGIRRDPHERAPLHR
jgi:2-hydroxy-6-oxonona-2,4-dienedioate hydrolase